MFYRVEIECDLTTINSVIIASIACHGNYDKALQFHEDSYKLYISTEQSSKVILNDIDSIFNIRGQYGETLNYIGIIYRVKGERSSALDYQFKSLRLKEKYLPTQHKDIAKTLNNSIAALFNDTDRLNGVMGYYEKYFPLEYDIIGLIKI
ncbi:unnamed protein product [Adineta steineri]|uniref:Uncharacterized protein n=1 Tax=Adineta steineri TaxID=433720 RepID=A0A814I5S9_9BILA|nr:unnamed protein product [Adineta steineri]